MVTPVPLKTIAGDPPKAYPTWENRNPLLRPRRCPSSNNRNRPLQRSRLIQKRQKLQPQWCLKRPVG